MMQGGNGATLPSKGPKRRRGRRRTACAGCRVIRQKCDGGIPCSRCIENGLACVPYGGYDSRASERPLSSPASGPADRAKAPAFHVGRGPSISIVSRGPAARYANSECVAPAGGSRYLYGFGGGEFNGMMPTLGTDLPPFLHIPQVRDHVPGLPSSSVGREQRGASAAVCNANTWGRQRDTRSPPSVHPGRGEGESPVYPVAAGSAAFGEKGPRRGQAQDAGAWASLEMGDLEVQEGHIDAGIGDTPVEAGSFYVHWPVGGRDTIEVAFDVACRGLAELSYEGKLDISRARFLLTGLEFGFLVMGSGFACRPFLDVLRHCISLGGHVPRADPTRTSSSTAMAFLVHHAIAVGDPQYQPPPCGPSAAFAPGSKPAVHLPSVCDDSSRQRGHRTGGPDPLLPSLDLQQGHRPDPSVGPSVGPSLSHPQEHAWVTGPNGVPHLVSRGSSFDAGPLGPRGAGIEDAAAWLNELWSDPQAAACSLSIMEIDQPILVLRTNAYMAQEFVDEKELAMMADQLQTMIPMLLARFMTQASTIQFYTLFNSCMSYENSERTCYVEMINRRGQLVACLATMRWHHGPHHGINVVRFTPLGSLPTSLTQQPTPPLTPRLNPHVASIISSLAMDAVRRCALSSALPTEESLPVSAAPRPPLPPSMVDQDSWPLHGVPRALCPPSQAWHDLPTGLLGGSGGEAEPLPLQGLQPPRPPITSAALPAQAGPRSSTVAHAAQAEAVTAAGPVWVSGAAVGVGDVACPFSSSSHTLDPSFTAHRPLALPPSAVPGVSSGLEFDDDEVQLLLHALGGSVGDEARPV